MERKIQERYVDHGFGFPVTLLNVPMVKIRDQWTPDINYKKLQYAVLSALAHKPARLTGAEIRFIRHAFEMPVQAFAEVFACNPQAIMEWEEAGEASTQMDWATEKDIRLFIVDHLDWPEEKLGIEMLTLYRELRKELTPKLIPIEQDCQAIAC